MPKADLIQRGKGYATQQKFTTLSAREIKEQFREKGMKKGLSEAVNAVLRGEVDMREQLAVAWLQGSFQSGFVPDEALTFDKTASLKLVKVPKKVVEVSETVDSLKAAIAAAQAKLAAMESAGDTVNV